MSEILGTNPDSGLYHVDLMSLPMEHVTVFKLDESGQYRTHI